MPFSSRRLRRTDATLDGIGDRRRFRLTYVMGNAFEFWTGLAALIAAATFVIDPTALADSSVGQQASGYAWAWNAMYAIGGAGVLAGLMIPSPRWELVGLPMLAAAAMVNAVAIVAVRGAPGAAAGATYLAFVAASVMRARIVWNLARAAERHMEDA